MVFTTFVQEEWILGLVRLILGVVLIYHGWPKIKDLAGTTKGFAKMGFAAPGLFAFLVASIEFFGGLAILLGVFVEIAAVLVGFQFLTLTIMEMKEKKEFMSYQSPLLIVALSLILLNFGGGLYILYSYPLTLPWGGFIIALLLAYFVAYSAKR